LIVFGSIIAFSAYSWLLRVAPPARISTYAYVNPVVAMLLGWAMAGETLSLRTLTAAGVILGGVALITTGINRS
jgi:drug/metabolite transporter (DMT)-like permease